MSAECVDLGHEQSPTMLEAPVDRARAWLAADVGRDDCIVTLEAAAVDEVLSMGERMRAEPLPNLLREPGQFELPALTGVMQEVRRLLDGQRGIAVVDRMPLDDLDEQDAVAIFWVLGQLVGRPVAQKWDGTMLYDVMDRGERYSYGVRGSYTNVELLFHTDNAFAIRQPDYVGLLCLRPALEGGVSRFCSIAAVHNKLLEQCPRELERLYRPVLWDRQAEHAAGAPKVTRAPVFSYQDGRLVARLNVSLVRKGYDVAGVAMDDETRDALAALVEVSESPELWFELPIERGQLQYLNNRTIAHYRSEFKDHDEPALKRHLVRTWHRDQGLPTYDG